MWVLVAAAVLLQHCVADESLDLLVFAHVDHGLHQTISSAPKDNFIGSMLSIFKTMNSSYAACLVISKQQWRNLQAKSRFPNVCGSIGYINPEPVSLIWTIKTYPNILLHIIYLDLPFLDYSCSSAKLIISDAMYCGRRSHWFWYSRTSSITVHLQQHITLHGDTGFVATYFAIVVKPLDARGKEHRLIEFDHDVWMNTSSPLQFFSQNNQYDEAKFTWHVLVMFSKFIEFSIESSDEYQVYDGPGPLSPVLYNAKRSSAFHLYLEQDSPHLILHYTSVMQTLLTTDQHVVLSSHPNRNIVHGYRVRGRNKVLRINFLSIYFNEMLTDFPYKCLFGGLWYSTYNAYFSVCETDWKEEVIYHVTDRRHPDDYDAHIRIFIILYGSYAYGKVIMSLESNMESCYNRDTPASQLAFHLFPGCNQVSYVLPHNEYPTKTFKLVSGPVNLKVQILPLIYELYKLQLNITVSDSDILGLSRITYTYVIGTHAYLRYQNSDRVFLSNIQGNDISTWRLAIIKFIRRALCDYEHAFNGYLSLPGTQMVTLYPYESKCRCGVDGHLQYNVDIVSIDNNINVGVLFSETCASDCQQCNVTFTEYNEKYDTLFVHSFTSFPAYFDNIHSNSSVQINITVASNCKKCPLWVVVTGGWNGYWQQNFHLSSLKREEIDSQRNFNPER